MFRVDNAVEILRDAVVILTVIWRPLYDVGNPLRNGQVVWCERRGDAANGETSIHIMCCSLCAGSPLSPTLLSGKWPYAQGRQCTQIFPSTRGKVNNLSLYKLDWLPWSHVTRPISDCFLFAWSPFDTSTAWYWGVSWVTVWLVWLCETVPPAWGSCEYKQNRCTLGSGITLRGWGSCDQAY